MRRFRRSMSFRSVTVSQGVRQAITFLYRTLFEPNVSAEADDHDHARTPLPIIQNLCAIAFARVAWLSTTPRTPHDPAPVGHALVTLNYRPSKRTRLIGTSKERPVFNCPDLRFQTCDVYFLKGFPDFASSVFSEDQRRRDSLFSFQNERCRKSKLLCESPTFMIFLLSTLRTKYCPWTPDLVSAFST